MAATVVLPAGASAAGVKAGAAVVDASWHVGSSAGQYAGDCVTDGSPCAPVAHEDGTFDPTGNTTRRRASYGIQSRLQVRALVVEGPDGTRVALVKNDFYIPQDLVYRRAALLMEQEGDCGIGRESFTMAVTHDHSSPFYSSTSWGVWTFQDVFDVRFYEYMAQRMFKAVEQACDELVPVRVGASVSQFDKTHRHSYGPTIGDDGTPAGYPYSNTDHDLTVVRFDDISDPSNPKPLANLVNFSGHPEFLNGNDLISADYIAPMERMTDRQTGAVTIWTQGAVGTAEPERSTYHSVHERLEFPHREYAQSEYAGRLLADAITDTWDDIADGTPEDASRFVGFATDFPVGMIDRWYPGPFSHPYPGVSNCRTDKGLAGDPQLPVIGLPDCNGVAGGLDDLADLIGAPGPGDIFPGIDPGLSTDDFQALGIPVPENYGAPGYTGLQEDIDVHLQAVRLGDILFAICSCEQWYDQSTNIETRTDTVTDNEHLGYDWGAQCTENGDGTYAPDGSGTGTWTCPNPSNPTGATLGPLSDLSVKKMMAQVNNPANGWNDAANAASAESEPADPTEIKGNYSHDDGCGPTPLTPGNGPCGPGNFPVSADLGYKLTIPISMANDYNGYIATYREYQRGDHYRKALTAWGPHSSDYLASRLVTMGRQLKQPALVLPTDQQQEQVLVAKAALDTGVNDARATALGETGGGAIASYEADLPDDREPAIDSEPDDVERFGAAFFSWFGGSNFTDNPFVTVERKVGGSWETYADQSGELPLTLEFPDGEDVPSYLSGDAEWRWTAHFEAFVAPFDVGQGPVETPAGTYRFVVDGKRQRGGTAVDYTLTSREFEVKPWSGITVEDFRLEPDGTMSYTVGPRNTYEVNGNGGPDITDTIGPVDYPDSYDSPARFIKNKRTFFRDPAAPGDPDKLEWYCFACSFRPWIDAGDATAGEVTIFDTRTGEVSTHPATQSGGRWQTTRDLRPGEIAIVAIGDVTDEWANFNGGPAGPLNGGPAPPDPPDPPGPPDPPVPPVDSGNPGDPGGSPSRPCTDPTLGTEDDDTLRGDGAGNLILGLPGADQLFGRGGDDCLYGGPGDDKLRGNGGADLLFGQQGSDRLAGGKGGDAIAGGRGRDRISGGKGSDALTDGGRRDRVRAGAGDDVISGGGGDDRIKAGPGDDTIDTRGRGVDVVDCGPGKDFAKVGSVDLVRRCERVKRGR